MVSVSVFRTERWVALLRFLLSREEREQEKKKETKNRLYSKIPFPAVNAIKNPPQVPAAMRLFVDVGICVKKQGCDRARGCHLVVISHIDPGGNKKQPRRALAKHRDRQRERRKEKVA